MKIVLASVDKWYNRGKANEVHALKGIDMQVREAEIICIKGPSGSGKSTLLSIIGCLFVPTSGLAMLDGIRLSRLPDRFLTVYRREKIGFIFQRFQLIPELSVLANVTLPLLPLGISPGERERRADVLLARFGLEHRKTFPAAEISGGELQRTAIARALINDPPIILADEPTAHLDTSLSLAFMEIIGELRKNGKTIVITSHDPLVYGHAHVDRSFSMRDGSLAGPD